LTPTNFAEPANHYPPTPSDREWRDYGTSTTAYSATATARDHPELDCAFEAICETCTFFQTSIEFRPTLQRQRDHAAEHDQPHRATLFDQLLTGLDQEAS
jgi:hypothetical protein